VAHPAIDNIRNAILVGLEAVAIAALWLIVGVLASGAIERNFFGTSYIGNAGDLVGYMAAIVFGFGLAVALARGAHVKVDIFYTSYAPRILGAVNIAFKILGIAAGVILVAGSIALCMESYARGRMVYGVLEISAWIPQALMVLGTLAFLLEFIFGEERADDHLVTI
jgi:TRAP-type C4-dicarboxylate transport system permease small subunit